MPELPEVETVKTVLEPIVKGQTITSIDVLRDCTIVGDEKEFVSTLVGKTFKSISRIGKFMIFHLSDYVVFISHLRMEGKYFELLENEKNTKFSRVVFHLSNGHKVCYDDSRCFGMMKLTTEQEYKSVKDIAQLGPEPFDIKDVKYLMERTKKSYHPIKSTLLDQTLMTGLGNIYADEVLFASRIHPLTPAKLINKKQWEDIVSHSQRILKDAIEAGGSTIKSYHPGKDIDGNFQTRLLAYGQSDKPCPHCGHPMRFLKVGGRGSTFCPICQEKKGAPIKVALYGKIASGKSTVLDIFGKAKISTISCDKIVNDLYQRQDVIETVNKTFNILGSEIDKDILRLLLQDKKNKKKLESIIHPLVKKEVNNFLTRKEDILVVEVPLLYESKMENMFDYIIAVDIDTKLQQSRLLERNPDTANKMANLNNINTKFDESKKKADVVINNNTDLTNLEKTVNSIINKLKDRLN